MVPKDQLLMGVVSAALCAAGLWNGRWFLAETSKGRTLASWFGERKGLWVLRGLFAAGVVLGVLLATGVVNPIRWGTS